MTLSMPLLNRPQMPVLVSPIAVVALCALSPRVVLALFAISLVRFPKTLRPPSAWPHFSLTAADTSSVRCCTSCPAPGPCATEGGGPPP